MRKIITLTAVISAFAAILLFKPVSVNAQPIGSITYNFSGYTVPAGKNPIFTLNQSGIQMLLQKNADGTFKVDAAGNFPADRTAVANFVSSLASMYDVPGVTSLNKQAEINYLVTAINSGMSDPSHMPSVTTSAPVTPAAAAPAGQTALTDTTGTGTYIDVNLTNQQLIYVINGTPAIISEIVTGNTSKGHGTPVGTYAIYGKATNRTLKGQGYSAFVKYWMPFYKAYGLHDASWRGSFGGNIYKTNGSHGCVNMPSTTAQALFNTVNVGTPVIVHY